MGQKNIAVVGSGYWGKNLVRNFDAIGCLHTICERDQATRERFDSEYPDCNVESDYSSVLKDHDVQAVAIATPAETHAKLVEQALLAGKDVYVEKPLCLSVTEGRKLVDLASRQGLILMVGHLLWYHPAVIELKRLVTSGQLGRIQYIYSNRLNLGKIRREENILWSFAPHDISVILGLLNEMPNKVVSHGGNYLHESIADVTMSSLSFPSGVKAHIFVSWLHPFKEQKLVVVGDRQMAVFNDVSSTQKLTLFPHSVDWIDNSPVACRADEVVVPLEMSEPLRAECQHFVDCIESRCTPRTDGEEGLRVLTVLDQCQTSLQSRRSDDHTRGPLSNARTGVFVHDTSVIDQDVAIGNGTKIWHFTHVLGDSTIGDNCSVGQNVVIGPNVRVGNGVKIQNNVSVYEGVTLEDDVFCGPSMVFTNVHNPRSHISRMHEVRPTLVKRGATLGANSTIVCGVTVNAYAFVGAGAVVTKDVPAHALVVGNPARQIGWMCQCGLRLSFDNGRSSCKCGKSYVQIDETTISAVEDVESPDVANKQHST
ncbi:MAG: Gfo/Idh/MocA family oxidoreductase, partial [Planctomycetales bacterium]|nr:Gfo/Idh/MocA family oxidoreductase [Planctomycetales bacterium]